MTRYLRIGVLVVLAVVVLTAGCLSDEPGDAVSSQTADTSTPTERSETQTERGTEWAGKQPDPDKEVNLENRWNRSAEIRVSVTREATNETVHNGTYNLDPGEDRAVFTTSEADPDGIESFTVTVTAQNMTDHVSIKTSKCYGDAYAEVRTDGSLHLYYEIC